MHIYSKWYDREETWQTVKRVGAGCEPTQGPSHYTSGPELNSLGSARYRCLSWMLANDDCGINVGGTAEVFSSLNLKLRDFCVVPILWATKF